MAKQALRRSGFDYMTSQQDLLGIFTQSNFGTFPTGRFGSGKCLGFNSPDATTTNINLGPGGNVLDTGLLPASYSTAGACCFALAFLTALNGNFIIRVSEDTVAAHLTLVLSGVDNSWKVYRGTLAGTLIASGTSMAITNIGGSTYIPIQFGWVIDNAAGKLFLRVNGTTILDGTTTSYDTQNGGSAVWNRISFTQTAVGFVINTFVDDFVLFDMGGDAFTTLPRDARFYLGVPTSNGTVAWTPSSGTNWAAVATNDGDTLYNHSLTPGQEDTFNVSATWIPNGSSIYGTPQLVRKSRIDDATPHDVKSAVISGGTTTYGATTAEFSTYTLFVDEIALDPNGGIAWTLASLQAVDIGYNLVL